MPATPCRLTSAAPTLSGRRRRVVGEQHSELLPAAGQPERRATPIDRCRSRCAACLPCGHCATPLVSAPHLGLGACSSCSMACRRARRRANSSCLGTRRLPLLAPAHCRTVATSVASQRHRRSALPPARSPATAEELIDVPTEWVDLYQTTRRRPLRSGQARILAAIARGGDVAGISSLTRRPSGGSCRRRSPR